MHGKSTKKRFHYGSVGLSFSSTGPLQNGTRREEARPLRNTRSQFPRANGGRSRDLPGCECLCETRCLSLRSARRHGSAIRPAPRVRRAFTLVEFLVVISITAILTALLMPSLSKARLAAMRLECANNLRQIGCGLISYTEDSNDRLPPSDWTMLSTPRYAESMCLTAPSGGKPDGLGRLLAVGGLGYLADHRLLYCPCHHGEHGVERYSAALSVSNFSQPIYSNFQYRGSVDPVSDKRIVDPISARWILAVDGFRTRADVNHLHGTNRLHGDCSTSWRADQDGLMLHQLPVATDSNTDQNIFRLVWRFVDSDGMTR